MTVLVARLRALAGKRTSRTHLTNTNSKEARVLSRFSAWMFFLVMSGCSSIGSTPPEEVVRARAEAQGQALVDQDFEKALSYTTPAYQNSPRAQLYQANHSGSSFWVEAEVAWVKCDEGDNPERCNVRLWVFGQFPRPGRYTGQRGVDVPISLDSVWIKIDRQWYQYLK